MTDNCCIHIDVLTEEIIYLKAEGQILVDWIGSRKNHESNDPLTILCRMCWAE